jgi:hypothetical protein
MTYDKVDIFTVIEKVCTGDRLTDPFHPTVIPFIDMAIIDLLHIVDAINVSLIALSWILLRYLVFTQDRLNEAKLGISLNR